MTPITSTSNPKVKWVRKLQSQRSARHAEGHFVIEGKRLLQEALNAGAQVPLLLHDDSLDGESQQLIQAFAQLGAQVAPTTSEVMLSCSDTETPQGMLAVVELPDLPSVEEPEPLLIADGIRDPGNLGTLMRSALAARIARMLLTPGTVDVLNPKVVRAAMGAHFYLPFETITIDNLATVVKSKSLWFAEANRGERYDCVDWTRPTALLIGGEAHGPSTDSLRLNHKYVHIPVSDHTESLNASVAGSIVMFEIARQRGYK